MARLNGVSNYLNYFNNLVNNQIAQNRNTSAANNTSQTDEPKKGTNTTEELSPELSSALNSLAGLLSTAKSQNDNTGVVSQVSKLLNAGANIENLASVMDSIDAQNGDDLLYTRTQANDPNITNQNKQVVIGADMQAFLNQANKLAVLGQDVNKYIDAVGKVMEKGDYDDLRRFISVVDTTVARGQNLNSLYQFSDEVMDKRHYDHESNMFSVQTMMLYGTSLENALKIMKNMENTGLEGRNNMVDLNRVIIDARNEGVYVPYLLNEMAKSGDSRAFMNAYMASQGMQTTAPDFTKFDRIERIDGEDMVIKQGESAALFAQAISSADGLLPESVLHWSSVQTGAISKGSSYLDLSKLPPGTYDIYVKIGPGYGGTDTAKKRVTVLANDDTTGHNNNGLGDTKDDDNGVKFEDSSNPGHNKTDKDTGKVKNNNGLGDTKDSDNTVKFQDSSNPGHNKTEAPKVATQAQRAAYTQYTQSFNKQQSDVDKMERLIEQLIKPKMKKDDFYNFLDEKVGKENVVSFLDTIGQTSLSKKYQKRNIEWLDNLLAIGKDPDFFKKSSNEFRKYIEKDDARKFLEKRLTQNETNEALKLLGYTQDLNISEGFQIKNNNSSQKANVNESPDRR